MVQHICAFGISLSSQIISSHSIGWKVGLADVLKQARAVERVYCQLACTGIG